MRQSFPLAIALLLAACSGTAPSTSTVLLSFAPTSPPPRAGAMLALTLENRGASGVTYNLCADASIERRMGNAWEPLPPQFTLCTLQLLQIASGATVNEQYQLPAPLAAGRYRLVIEFGGSSAPIVSSVQFEVP